MPEAYPVSTGLPKKDTNTAQLHEAEAVKE